MSIGIGVLVFNPLDNIALIDYKFDSVRIILWLYCFRYKAKVFFKK